MYSLPSKAYNNRRTFFAGVAGACLNGIAVGTLAGWPQAAIPQLVAPPPGFGPAYTDSEVSWIASIFFLGMLTGGFTSLAVVSTFGKRKLFLLATFPFIVGWSTTVMADTFWEFVFARIILGVSGGMMCTQTEMYLSEISPPRLRGGMSVVFCICVHTGVLLSFAVGPALTISGSAALYLALGLILAGLYLAAVPETPFWLIREGKLEEALHVLRRLRGTCDVHHEFDDIVEFVESSRKIGEKTERGFAYLKKVMDDRANRKALLLVVLLTTAQQFSGMAAMQSYAQLTFERTVTVIPGRYVSLLLGVVELICTFVSGWAVDRVGRRPLVAVSSITCSGCMALLGLYFHGYLGNGGSADKGALPIACIIMFALAFGLGLGTMSTVVASECLSMEARNIGAAMQNTTLCISIFVITKLWPVIGSTYGREYSFWTASIITGVHAVVLLILLPETRGRSLTEIQALLSGTPRTLPAKPATLALLTTTTKDAFNGEAA